MKLELNVGTGVVTNSEENETVDFSIGDPSIVIDILRNKLYSNPIRTLVQEYISNARDAMREAGKENESIQVTYPTGDLPTFKVRDYGCGLSPDRMKQVFVNYGSSTKRKDNNQIGGFGIGAKSGWAYTDSFTIITYVDGTAYHYVAHTGKKNTGSLELLSKHETEEDNGTEIQIAVKNENLQEFTLAINRATFFHKVNTIFLPYPIGKDPTLILDISDDIKMYSRESEHLKESRLFFNIDGIIYPVDVNKFDNEYIFDNAEHPIVVNLKTGDVEIAANRENISTSPANVNNIDKILNVVNKQVWVFLNETLTQQGTAKEFVDGYVSLTDFFRFYYQEFTHGKFSIKLNHLIHSTFKFKKEWNLKKNYSGKERFYELSLTENINLEKEFVCLLVDSEYSQAKLKTLIKQVLKEQDKETAYVYEKIEGEEFAHFVEDMNVIPISRIVPEKKTRKRKSADSVIGYVFRNTRRYSNTLVATEIKVKGKLEDKDKVFIYVLNEDTEEQRMLFHRGTKLLKEYTEDKYEFCFLSKKNLELVKDAKNFIPCEEILKNPKILGKHYITLVDAIKGAFYDKLSNDIPEYLKLEGYVFKDKTLEKMFNLKDNVSMGETYIEYDDVLTKNIIESNVELKDLQINIDSYIAHVRKYYPMLVNLVHFSTKNDCLEQDVKDYLDMKYEKQNNLSSF